MRSTAVWLKPSALRAELSNCVVVCAAALRVTASLSDAPALSAVLFAALFATREEACAGWTVAPVFASAGDGVFETEEIAFVMLRSRFQRILSCHGPGAR